MIIADKIIMLRKKNGWSQEDLAEKLQVSRQSVSKWESGLSVPDLNKIIAMSELFGVSTDYLLKDELETISASETQSNDDASRRSISAEEVNRYLSMVTRHARRIAFGVLLCILSPALLIFLVGGIEANMWGIGEEAAVAIGVIVMIGLVACAVALFIPSGLQLREFEYLEKESISLAYGVTGIVEKRREEYGERYRFFLTCGVLLCIFSVLPLLISGAIGASEFWLTTCVALLLCICAVGVFFIVLHSYIEGSYEKLLQIGDYTEEKKKSAKSVDAIATAYWCIASAIYLAISFITGKWHITWIIWPVAGCLWPLIPICFGRRKK